MSELYILFIVGFLYLGNASPTLTLNQGACIVPNITSCPAQRAWRRLEPGRNLSFQFEQVHAGKIVLYVLLPAEDQCFVRTGIRSSDVVVELPIV